MDYVIKVITLNDISENIAVYSSWHLKLFIFSIWVFFHEHSRYTGQQEKGEAISLTLLYHFHPLHRYLEISWAITAESSPLLAAGLELETFSFQEQVVNH